MLTPDILKALKGYTANMNSDVTLVLQPGEHEKRAELKKFLEDVASVSDRITFEERDESEKLRSPVSFLFEVNGEDSGIRFSGIPGGHEFNSFVLALLHISGTPIKLDDSLKDIIGGIDEELKFEVFMSLSCHNCPDVVQALNQFSAINPKISVETIDGGLYPELVEERNIQGVPTVFLNGKVFANGKVDPSVLVTKLMEAKPEAVKKNAGGTKLPLQDMVIIGGGPAGVASAIYGARKGLKVTIVADRVGGQVKDTVGIENFISVPQTTGTKLSGDLLTHMRDYDITLKEPFLVEKIEQGATKKVHLTSGEVVETKTVIIASGAKWRELGCPGEKENIGNGVAYCPHCDGPFFKGKDVAVIGGGNSGVEAALDLAGIVKSVTVFEFMPDLKADKVLVDQAEKRENIRIVRNAATEQIVAEGGKVTAIEYKDRGTGEQHRQDLAGVFVQIGLVPNSAFVKDLVETTKFGEIVINERCETSEPGIFACGDVTTVPYKQIVIAMGEGSKASLSAFDYLIRNFSVETEVEQAA
jgi:alkyl hydroperoxide reductase subunit F